MTLGNHGRQNLKMTLDSIIDFLLPSTGSSLFSLSIAVLVHHAWLPISLTPCGGSLPLLLLLDRLELYRLRFAADTYVNEYGATNLPDGPRGSSCSTSPTSTFTFTS